jgi:protein gp37
MAENSKIEWTGATWNPTVGCSIVSPGCHCHPDRQSCHWKARENCFEASRCVHDTAHRR